MPDVEAGGSGVSMIIADRLKRTECPTSVNIEDSGLAASKTIIVSTSPLHRRVRKICNTENSSDNEIIAHRNHTHGVLCAQYLVRRTRG
jgi:hypothetical protein